MYRKVWGETLSKLRDSEALEEKTFKLWSEGGERVTVRVDPWVVSVYCTYLVERWKRSLEPRFPHIFNVCNYAHLEVC